VKGSIRKTDSMPDFDATTLLVSQPCLTKGNTKHP
jgi:hypothetical protein